MLDDAPLYMVQLALETPGLFEAARQRRLPVRDIDTGYLVHCRLVDLFGDEAPKPFVVEGSQGRLLRVLGYGRNDAPTLTEAARRYASPDAFSSCRWPISTKAMPEAWPPGHQLGFEVRFCPVVRVSSDNSRQGAGAEVDVFLRACSEHERREAEGKMDREAVYRDWLARELARGGAATPLTGEMVNFRLARLLRRTQGMDRASALTTRPDVTIRGTLRIDDGPAFSELLARGIGRHRSFGFGMLRLVPPGR